MAPFLDERGRRLFTASEARAAGRGGVTAVATATRVARSTIGRGLAELRLGRGDLGSRARRPGGGRKPAGETQPGLLEALSELVQSAIRGDPEAAVLWVSKDARVRASQHRGQKQCAICTEPTYGVCSHPKTGSSHQPMRSPELSSAEKDA